MIRALSLIGAFILAVLAVAAVALFGPWGDRDFTATPHPAVGYDDAVSRVIAVQSAEKSPDIAEQGRSIALLHGSRTATSVVIFHGFTSCPGPYRALAEAYYKRGYNVWVPRAPQHGLADYLTDAPAKIDALGLKDYADDAVDVGTGLGGHLVVVGQSGGGTLATWALAERHEVVQAFAISPFLHPKTGLPLWQMRPLGRLAAVGALRGLWRWWDPLLKRAPSTRLIVPSAYPRANVNALMQYLDIGRWLLDQRAAAGPPLGSLTLIVNEADPDIDASYNLVVANKLMAGRNFHTYVIPEGQDLGHDLVDAEGPNRLRMRSAYLYLSDALGVDLPDPTAARK